MTTHETKVLNELGLALDKERAIRAEQNFPVTTHTNLPWYITLESTPFTRVRRGPDVLASFEFGADAELAVERVNGWDKLVASEADSRELLARNQVTIAALKEDRDSLRAERDALLVAIREYLAAEQDCLDLIDTAGGGDAGESFRRHQRLAEAHISLLARLDGKETTR